MNNILVIGSAMVDININIERFPAAGTDIQASCEFINIGGCALNVASVLNCTGISQTLFIPVGTGRYGDMVKAALKEEGYCTCLEIGEGDNGHCYALLEDNGERTFITMAGIECEFKKEWFLKIDGLSFTHVYVSGYSMMGESGKTLVEYFEAHPHMKIFFAPGPRIGVLDQALLQRIYRLKPVIHLNQEELETVTNEKNAEKALEKLRMQTGETVIVTMGAEGAAYITEDHVEWIQGEPVAVANTSGAGDSHIGGVITGLAKGMGMKEAIIYANKISARVVGQEGTKYRGEAEYE